MYRRAGDISGGGTVTKSMDGVLTLTGDWTHSGQPISTRTLIIEEGSSTGSISGSIWVNSDLVFNRSDPIVHAGRLTGSGQITKLGDANLTLLQPNCLTAMPHPGQALTVQENALQQLGSAVLLNDAALALEAASIQEFPADISGSGLRKTGSGDTILTGVVSSGVVASVEPAPCRSAMGRQRCPGCRRHGRRCCRGR